MPEVSSVRDADRVVGLLPPSMRPQLIVNRLRPQMVRKGKMLSVDDVNAILQLPLLGVVVDEPAVIIAANRGEPVALDAATQTGAAFRAIAARVAGEDVAAPMPRADNAGVFGRIGAFLRGQR